jgi:hypothetical protein
VEDTDKMPHSIAVQAILGVIFGTLCAFGADQWMSRRNLFASSHVRTRIEVEIVRSRQVSRATTL